jgi:hypothetical protein
MSNDAECCALQICCPPAEAQAALAKILVRDTGCGPVEAVEYAACVLHHFALAPRSFENVVADIVKQAQKHFQAGV